MNVPDQPLNPPEPRTEPTYMEWLEHEAAIAAFKEKNNV